MCSTFSFHKPSVTTTSKTEVNEVEIRRKACDPTGRLGSLYDARTDNFIKCYPVLQEPPLDGNKKAEPVCNIWYFSELKKNENPLSKLNIENELCLSLYLDMCNTKIYGAASLAKWKKPFDQRTIFLLYTFTTRMQRLPENNSLLYNHFERGIFDSISENATHILHKIIWGFEVLFVIQVPSYIEKSDNNGNVDRLILKICDLLKHRASTKRELTQNDANLWAKLNIKLPITSPISLLSQTKDIEVIIKEIRNCESSWYGYQYPLWYILKPIDWIHNNNFITSYICLESAFPTDSRKIQRQLFLLGNALNKLADLLYQLQETDRENRFLPKSTYIKNELHQRKRQRCELHDSLRVMLTSIRLGKQDFRMLSKIIGEPQYDPLRLSSITPLLEECQQLYDKVCLIDQLTNQHFQYQLIQDKDNPLKKEEISKLFMNSNQHVCILCSSDTLIKQNENLWNSCRQQLIKKKNDDPTVRLIFADLSYCKHEDIKETIIISSESRTTKSTLSLTEKMTEKTDVNVLLLGESGVGKSTFINAFVNYLTFDSLKQAAAGEPVVLIPVSFLLTFNHNFDEFVVKFGDVDANEDHDHPGQSVTQYCKSYVFDISNKLRLRLIDTPGVGDTRGLEQDMINIDRILSYINNFPHINAICILLQPNATRLSVFFRTCILQLFTYLTPAARDNIIFCFTNTRLTFFAPGNTAPILKSFLKELPIHDIPFIKKNSFCFDSESFRYLAAVKNNVHFNEHQQQECHKSWVASVTESERLFKFIYTLKPYYMSRCQSEKHAKLEIYTMIRPIMEVFRKVLITQVLQDQSRSNVTMMLYPKNINIPSVICSKGTCDLTAVKCDIFEIVQYPLHQLSNIKMSYDQRCNLCQCSPDKHMLTDYELEYKFLTVAKPTQSIKDDDINWWYNLCIQFAFFIGSIDPFVLYFDRFIDETQAYASLNQKAKKAEYIGNVQINKELIHIRRCFVEYAQKNSTKRKPDLAEIYQYIADAMRVQDIKLQINAIKQSRLAILKKEEPHIEKPSRSTGILYRITEQSTDRY